MINANAALSASKQALRKRMATVRQALPPGEVQAKSVAICNHLASLLGDGDGRVIGLFAAIRNEVDLLPLLPVLRASHWQVAFPRIVADAVSGNPSQATLEFCVVANGDALAPEPRFGIPEPTADILPIRFDELNAVVVPGLVFDRRGHRLGWGAGYYDRVLRQMRARRIGACYAFQLVEACPVGPDDEAVHLVVTDQETIFFDAETVHGSASSPSRI